MRPKPTVRIGAALAAISFVLASGLSASGLHASLHVPSHVQPEDTPPGSDVADAHHAVNPALPDTHQQDTSDDCSCVGTCASATPRAAPSTDEVLVHLGGVERDAVTHVVRTTLLGQLKPYLFPLPNAPPIRT